MLDVKTQVSPSRLQCHKRTSFNIVIILLIAVALVVFANVILGPVLRNAFNATAGLSNFPVSGGYADPVVKQSAWDALLSFQKAAGCDNVTSASISVQQEPDAQGVWFENWQVNQCGAMKTYRIRFAPDPSGRTVYAIGK